MKVVRGRLLEKASVEGQLPSACVSPCNAPFLNLQMSTLRFYCFTQAIAQANIRAK